MPSMNVSEHLNHCRTDFTEHTVVFAPIALIMKYDTIDQAVEIANGTRYGLGASVFGPVRDDCIKVAKRLQCGMVAVNDFGVFYVSVWVIV